MAKQLLEHSSTRTRGSDYISLYDCDESDAIRVVRYCRMPKTVFESLQQSPSSKEFTRQQDGLFSKATVSCVSKSAAKRGLASTGQSHRSKVITRRGNAQEPKASIPAYVLREREEVSQQPAAAVVEASNATGAVQPRASGGTCRHGPRWISRSTQTYSACKVSGSDPVFDISSLGFTNTGRFLGDRDFSSTLWGTIDDANLNATDDARG